MFNFIRNFPINPFSFFASRAVNSYVRFLHASPGTVAVDIYANSKLIASNLSYKNFTEYLTLTPGNYKIEVFQAGHKFNPFISTTYNFPPGTIYTNAIIGRIPTLSMRFVSEPYTSIPEGKTFIRFAHYSPTVYEVNVLQSDGTVLFKNIAYRQVANYIPVDAGTYVISIREIKTNKTVLYVPNIHLLEGKFYTFYLVGLSVGTPPLQLLIPLDGNSYLKF